MKVELTNPSTMKLDKNNESKVCLTSYIVCTESNDRAGVDGPASSLNPAALHDEKESDEANADRTAGGQNKSSDEILINVNNFNWSRTNISNTLSGQLSAGNKLSKFLFLFFFFTCDSPFHVTTLQVPIRLP